MWESGQRNIKHVSAAVILTHCAGVKLTHLGEDGGFWLPMMLTQEQAVEIKVLMRRGAGIREMARELGCSRNTIRRYLREAAAAAVRAEAGAPNQA